MNKRIARWLAALGVVAGVVSPLIVTAPVYAEEEDVPARRLQISPTAVTVTLESGDVLVGQAEKCPQDVEGGCVVEVKNTGSEAFSYRVYASPYVVNGVLDDGSYDLNFDTNATNSYTQIVRWISFLNEDDSEYTDSVIRRIAPGETQTIHYRIDVPEDVPGGAQYAVIWAQTLSDGAISGVSTAAQAGMVVSGRSIGDTRQTAEVTNYHFTRFAIGGSLKANATIKNTGNADFDAYYFYTARTLFGKELYSDSGATAMFPDMEYQAEVEWENTPLLGIFSVEFRVSAADTVIDETHIVVIMPIFIIVLLILLLTIIIVWIIIISRKRKERKARALV